ncbi:MAG: class I SAM-dependent methyltransferase [Desulfurococcaceae archaeon]
MELGKKACLGDCIIRWHYHLSTRLLRRIGVYEHRTEAYLRIIKEFIRDLSKLTIVDIGCGSGVFSIALAKDNFVVALDIDRKPLRAIKKIVAVVNADAHYLPFKSESFDVVLSLVNGASGGSRWPCGRLKEYC